MTEEAGKREIAKVHEQVATRNAQAAVQRVAKTESELIERIDRLEGLVLATANQVAMLQEKYNLLLTKNFHGGSTSE